MLLTLRKMRLFMIYGGLLLIPALIMGCSIPRKFSRAGTTISYVHPTYDFSLLTRLAVLPFVNETNEQGAAEQIRRIVITEILSGGYVDVVEPGQVSKRLGELNLAGTIYFSKEDYRRMGEAMDVPVLILGSLSEYGFTTVGGVQLPEISMTIWAVEAQSGTVVWSVSTISKGLGVSGQLFGFSSTTVTEATFETVRRAVRTLF